MGSFHTLGQIVIVVVNSFRTTTKQCLYFSLNQAHFGKVNSIFAKLLTQKTNGVTIGSIHCAVSPCVIFLQI